MLFNEADITKFITTGAWDALNYGNTPNYNRGSAGKVFVSTKDRDILKRLAEKVSNLACREAEKVKRKLWYDHNSLKSKDPLILCDPENGWNEIITENKLQCEDELARHWEMVLRKEIFCGEELKDDKPIEKYFEIGYTLKESDWGINEIIHGYKGGGSYVWKAPVKDLSDLNKIEFPKIEVDYDTTEKTLELANDIFSDLLNVRIKGHWWWGLCRTYELARLLGFNQILFYLYDNPELMHEAMGRIRDFYLENLDFLEKENLLSLNNDNSYVGSGGLGYTNELPAKDFDGTKIRTVDMWGNFESQETINVSPKMFEEFVFKYQFPISKRFGLNCYGCCEPLEDRWNIIKHMPNLRRVSVSPWADMKKMVNNLEDKYIYSLKASPIDLTFSEIDESVVRKKIQNDLRETKGCVVEIIMKDNQTLGRNPNNLIDWVRIVREEVEKI